MTTPALVTRPYPTSGLGSNLNSLAGALWIARGLDRRLLVDWRGMVDVRDPAIDYFTRFFEPLGEILGVAVAHAPDDEEYRAASAAGTVPFLSPEEASGLARAGARPDGPYLAIQTSHGPERVIPLQTRADLRERQRLLEAVYAELTPRPEILSAVDRWAEENMAGSFVVALNIRTGNGGADFRKGGVEAKRFDQDVLRHPRFLARVERACRDRAHALPPERRDDARILVVTDSTAMQERLMRLPGAMTRRTRFPPHGADHQYLWEAPDYTDVDAVSDTIADMFLLARADALVHNFTNFNKYALTVTNRFGGNAVNIERYFLPGRYRLARTRALEALMVSPLAPHYRRARGVAARALGRAR
jgi:hypothetical protein